MISVIKFMIQGRSRQWRKLRTDHLADFPRCAACSTDKKIEVHHIEPFHLFPAKELDLQNLITLCKNCHLVLGHLRDYDIYNRNIRLDCLDFQSKRLMAYSQRIEGANEDYRD
jgi:hypothetical protein